MLEPAACLHPRRFYDQSSVCKFICFKFVHLILEVLPKRWAARGRFPRVSRTNPRRIDAASGAPRPRMRPRLAAAAAPAVGLVALPVLARLLNFVLDTVGEFRRSGLIALGDTPIPVVRSARGYECQQSYGDDCGRDRLHRVLVTTRVPRPQFTSPRDLRLQSGPAPTRAAPGAGVRLTRS